MSKDNIADKETIFEAPFTEQEICYILSQDWFWENFEKHTGIDISLEAILKRNGVYSEEKLKEAQEISNRNRIAQGKKPLFEI